MSGSGSLAAVIAETRLGFAGVGLSAAGIRHATLFHRTRAGAEAELRAWGAAEVPDARAHEVEQRLRDFANGAGDTLAGFPVDLPAATELQSRAWVALRTIPYGETRTYSWLAKVAGAPGRARAIGAIMGSNPVPLWLPCHRVVAIDGSLHGFAGGLGMKRELLELEGGLPRSLLPVMPA